MSVPLPPPVAADCPNVTGHTSLPQPLLLPLLHLRRRPKLISNASSSAPTRRPASTWEASFLRLSPVPAACNFKASAHSWGKVVAVSSGL